MCELQLIVQNRYTQKPLYCDQMELSMYQIDIGVHKKVRQYDFLIVWLCTAHKLVKKFIVLLQWTIIFSSYRSQLWKFSDWKSASNCHLARFDIHCTAYGTESPFSLSALSCLFSHCIVSFYWSEKKIFILK